MSLLRRSIGSKLLASSSRRLLPTTPRYQARTYADSPDGRSHSSATDPAVKKDGELAVIPQQEAADGVLRNQPDYATVPDYRTSTFSIVPSRVMDGSEPGDTLPAAVLSGAPVDLQARTVRIYRPAKPATQSGDWHSHQWLIDWDPLPKGHRWENPLMGWQSTADAMQGERVGFRTKEDAIRFANKQGYEYFVQEPNERRFTPKAYASQFVWHPKKLKAIHTK